MVSFTHLLSPFLLPSKFSLIYSLSLHWGSQIPRICVLACFGLVARCTSHHFQPLHWKFWPKALFPQNVKVRKQTLIHIQWETLVMSSFSKLVSRLVQNFDKSSLPKITFLKTNSNLLSECEHLVWYLIKKETAAIQITKYWLNYLAILFPPPVTDNWSL